MLELIKKFLYTWGKMGERIDRKKSTYTPQYSGQWVNKGTDEDERWEWIEKSKSLRTYYVNVFHLEGDYVITIGFNPRKNAIETIDCRDEREVQIALNLLKVYYGTLGNTIIDSKIQ